MRRGVLPPKIGAQLADGTVALDWGQLLGQCVRACVRASTRAPALVCSCAYALLCSYACLCLCLCLCLCACVHVCARPRATAQVRVLFACMGVRARVRACASMCMSDRGVVDSDSAGRGIAVSSASADGDADLAAALRASVISGAPGTRDSAQAEPHRQVTCTRRARTHTRTRLQRAYEPTHVLQAEDAALSEALQASACEAVQAEGEADVRRGLTERPTEGPTEGLTERTAAHDLELAEALRVSACESAVEGPADGPTEESEVEGGHDRATPAQDQATSSQGRSTLGEACAAARPPARMHAPHKRARRGWPDRSTTSRRWW